MKGVPDPSYFLRIRICGSVIRISDLGGYLITEPAGARSGSYLDIFADIYLGSNSTDLDPDL